MACWVTSIALVGFWGFCLHSKQANFCFSRAICSDFEEWSTWTRRLANRSSFKIWCYLQSVEGMLSFKILPHVSSNAHSMARSIKQSDFKLKREMWDAVCQIYVCSRKKGVSELSNVSVFYYYNKYLRLGTLRRKGYRVLVVRRHGDSTGLALALTVT